MMMMWVEMDSYMMILLLLYIDIFQLMIKGFLVDIVEMEVM